MHDDAEEPPQDASSLGSADASSLGGRDLLALGGMLVGSVVLGVVIGELLDLWLGTSPAFVLAGIALGIVSAGVGFWLRVRTFLRS